MDITTLNIDNYSDHELFDLFDIELENIHNQELLQEKYDLLTNNMNDTDVNMEYAKNWRLNPNNIPDNDGETPEFPPEGTYPFYADEDYDAVDKTPPSYPTPTIFWDGSDGDDNSGFVKVFTVERREFRVIDDVHHLHKLFRSITIYGRFQNSLDVMDDL